MKRLTGKRILVTSGATRARIDAVRFISSTSSGRLGAAIAREALREGADVLYLHGPGAAFPCSDGHPGLTTVEVAWLQDLHNVAKSTLRYGSFHAIAHAMAVLDYAPRTPANRKTRSGLPSWTITFEPTPKLLPRLREWHPLSFVVGFKLLWSVSQEQLCAAAQELLSQNRLQLVAANDLSLITGDSHPAILVNHTGVIAHTNTKAELARVLVDAMSGRSNHE